MSLAHACSPVHLPSSEFVAVIVFLDDEFAQFRLVLKGVPSLKRAEPKAFAKRKVPQLLAVDHMPIRVCLGQRLEQGDDSDVTFGSLARDDILFLPLGHCVD